MSMDKFGGYVVQLMLKVGTPQQQSDLVQILHGEQKEGIFAMHLNDMARDRFGVFTTYAVLDVRPVACMLCCMS